MENFYTILTTDSDYSLPTGGTYAYYCNVINNNFPVFAGLSAEGAAIGSGTMGLKGGFYWKVA